MSHAARRNEPTRRLYRNRETGMIMGVCAGIAEFFDFELWMVRVITVVALVFVTGPVLVLYFALGFLLRDRPLYYYDREREARFWRSGHGPHGYR